MENLDTKLKEVRVTLDTKTQIELAAAMVTVTLGNVAIVSAVARTEYSFRTTVDPNDKRFGDFLVREGSLVDRGLDAVVRGTELVGEYYGVIHNVINNYL